MKNTLDYSMLRQARVYEEMIHHVIRAVDSQLGAVLPMKEIFDAQKIYITGCGDSWLAGVAAKAAFESITKVETHAMRAIEFSRHLNSKNLGYSPNTPMVILISYSGEATRVVECARRATARGANTIAITSNSDSRLAKACCHVVNVGLPAGGEYYPGATTYNASMTALLRIAMRIGRAKNTISGEDYQDMDVSLYDYVRQVQQQVEPYALRAEKIAQSWKDLRCYDFIGDYADYATAFFGSAKVIETFGGYTTYDDSEDWCHINYFLAQPETIGRVVIANKATPSYGRVQETLAAIKLLESPLVVVTDAPAEEFPENAEVFTMPVPKYFWLAPLGQHVPFDLIAGCIAELKGERAFRANVPEFDDPLLNDRLKYGTEIKIV